MLTATVTLGVRTLAEDPAAGVLLGTSIGNNSMPVATVALGVRTTAADPAAYLEIFGGISSELQNLSSEILCKKEGAVS